MKKPRGKTGKEKKQEKITGSELGRRVCISKVAVHKAKKSGRITPDKDGLYDAEQAIKDLEANTDPALQRGERAKASGLYSQFRTLLESYKVKQAKLDYERALGELIPKKEVERGAFESARRTRDYLLNIPNRIAGEVASALGVSPAEGQERVYQILNREIHQALEQLPGPGMAVNHQQRSVGDSAG